MVFPSAYEGSDVSSWDDCDSRTSWDVISASGSVHQNRGVGGSEASSIGVAVISDLDAFTFDNHSENEERDEPSLNDQNDGAAAAEDDESDNLSLDLCSISSSHSSSTICCPLTLDKFKHPYYCEVDHRVYEKKAIFEWVKNNGTSPITRQTVSLNQLRPFHESDDDDTNSVVSVSTDSGWPRPLTAFYHKKGQVVPQHERRTSSHSSPAHGTGRGGGSGSGNYRNALLSGGGGVSSEKAKALSKKRPIAIKQTQLTSSLQQQAQQLQRKKQSLPMSLYPLSHKNKNSDNDDEYDDEDYFYSEYQARKGALSRYQGKMVLGASMKGVRGRIKFTNLRDYLSQREHHAAVSGMDRIEENFEYENERDDDEVKGYSDYRW